MLSNAYFLAKFRFDTAENEPAKKLQNFAQKIAKFANHVANLIVIFAIPEAMTGGRGASVAAAAEKAARLFADLPPRSVATLCHALAPMLSLISILILNFWLIFGTL